MRALSLLLSVSIVNGTSRRVSTKSAIPEGTRLSKSPPVHAILDRIIIDVSRFPEEFEGGKL